MEHVLQWQAVMVVRVCSRTHFDCVFQKILTLMMLLSVFLLYLGNSR